MRRLAGGGLLLLVGCNQIFGIAPTQGFDAGADVIADRPHVVLDWQIATVQPSTATDPGAPSQTVTFAPISPSPVVRISTLDTPFAADASDDRDQTSYGADGSITIPHSYLATTWRLEYTLAGGIPHEVQWQPDDKQGHLTVPVFGRLARDPVPANSGYALTPAPAHSFTAPRVFTTGLWTEGLAVVQPGGTTVDYSFDNAISLDGTKGKPDSTQGDRALLIDYSTDASGCRFAIGSGAVTVDLSANTLAPQTPTWDTARKGVTCTAIDGTLISRLQTNLGALDSGLGISAVSGLLFGSVPSTDMPGLTETPSAKLLGLQLPIPAIQTLVQCPYSASLPSTAQPTLLDSFPRIVHAQLVDSRQVLGVSLASGMETVLTPSQVGSLSFTMAFPAAIPTRMALTTPGGATVDLSSGSADQIAIGPASGAFTLAFTPESGTDISVDYYDVVLHRISGGVLFSDRIYTVTAPQVRIDGAVLTPGVDYVFEVRSYAGHPKAQHGDFSAVQYPYGSAIVFTHTFKAS